MHLIQFQKTTDDPNGSGVNYHLKFSDGLEFDLNSHDLRDNCPCASCKGEQVLFHTYLPANNNVITKDGYELAEAKTVGNYALRLSWKDGHNTGIYSWDFLRDIFKNLIKE